jgi:hypothetical protein
VIYVHSGFSGQNSVLFLFFSFLIRFFFVYNSLARSLVASHVQLLPARARELENLLIAIASHCLFTLNPDLVTPRYSDTFVRHETNQIRGFVRLYAASC